MFYGNIRNKSRDEKGLLVDRLDGTEHTAASSYITSHDTMPSVMRMKASYFGTTLRLSNVPDIIPVTSMEEKYTTHPYIACAVQHVVGCEFKRKRIHASVVPLPVPYKVY